MDWGTELWDQFEVLERHTQWGLDLLDRYVKFVKERTEVEQAYAKQLRSLVKKYLPKRPAKDDPESKGMSMDGEPGSPVLESKSCYFPALRLWAIDLSFPFASSIERGSSTHSTSDSGSLIYVLCLFSSPVKRDDDDLVRLMQRITDLALKQCLAHS